MQFELTRLLRCLEKIQFFLKNDLNLMIKVLHITPDDKFFDGVFSCWEKLDKLSNEALLIANNESQTLRYIKTLKELQILSDEDEIRKKLTFGDYQILFFHSLSSRLYKYFRYIPKDKIVIWWAWGFDLYYENLSPQPFIPINLYKPLTRVFVKANNNSSWLHTTLRFLVKKILVQHQVTSIIQRIDYFQPVTKIEYQLMLKVRGFRAKEFYFEGSLGGEVSTNSRLVSGNILLGNSASITNNHLDVINTVLKNRKDNQQIILPLNYGGDADYVSWLKKYIGDIDNINPLCDFLPAEKYFQLLDTCTYACFGVVRQQAMGNIRYALCHGIKVFLYRDSVPYRSLKEMGFVIYAIEDIDSNSFTSPLTNDEMIQNKQAYEQEKKRRSHLYNKFQIENL